MAGRYNGTRGEKWPRRCLGLEGLELDGLSATAPPRTKNGTSPPLWCGASHSHSLCHNRLTPRCNEHKHDCRTRHPLTLHCISSAAVDAQPEGDQRVIRGVGGILFRRLKQITRFEDSQARVASRCDAVTGLIIRTAGCTSPSLEQHQSTSAVLVTSDHSAVIPA